MGDIFSEMIDKHSKRKKNRKPTGFVIPDYIVHKNSFL